MFALSKEGPYFVFSFGVHCIWSALLISISSTGLDYSDYIICLVNKFLLLPSIMCNYVTLLAGVVGRVWLSLS